MNLTQDFIHGSTKKSLAVMVLPLLIAMVLNMAYNSSTVSGSAIY